MLDAFNDRTNKDLNFAAWYQHQLKTRPLTDCDHPNLPAVWFDEDDQDDDLMAVTAPKKPDKPNGGDFLFEHAPTPENTDDPKQFVHV